MSISGRFLDIAAARKAFGSVSVLDGIDLAMPRGEFVSLLGPSGCGKTTLLRVVAGLLSCDAGRVQLDGVDLLSLPPHKRDVGVVFQNYALFPHLSVAENVGFGLLARGRSKGEAQDTAARFLELVHMSEYADRSVRQLSGGQQQRVAVARALAVQPKLLLLDEPFSALDRKLRETMQIELKRLLRELAITAVFVTHDQDEALVMSDRIAVMNTGRIEQIADPLTIYRRPATPFVLGFVGLSSRLRGRVVDAEHGQLKIETANGTIAARGDVPVGTRVMVAVRPERMHIASLPHSNAISTRFRDLAFQGSKALLHFIAKDGDQIMVETADLALDALKPDTETTVSWAIEDTLVYPAEVSAP